MFPTLFDVLSVDMVVFCVVRTGRFLCAVGTRATHEIRSNNMYVCSSSMLPPENWFKLR